MNAGDCGRLIEAGILLAYRAHLVVGNYDCVFSRGEALAAAAIGICAPDCVDAVLADPELRAEAAHQLLKD